VILELNVPSYRAEQAKKSQRSQAEPMNAECRGRLTFLFRTQLFPWILRISLVFPASEVRDLSPF